MSKQDSLLKQRFGGYQSLSLELSLKKYPQNKNGFENFRKLQLNLRSRKIRQVDGKSPTEEYEPCSGYPMMHCIW